MTAPTASAQLDFIERYQRLLDSGSFVATYKYALLLALANIAAEQGFDDDRPQEVAIRDLGAQFIRLYWTHTRQYQGLALRQNTGKQAAILSTVELARAAVRNPDRADAAEQVPERMVRQAASTVKTMPLWKLQTIGRQKADPDHPDNFLYPTRDVDGHIVLRPGVSACLRRFRALIVSTTQAAWAEYVRRQNPELGAGSDLESFLFGSDRTALHQVAPALLDLQGGRCFYTGRRLEPAQAHVDHFIPWAKYPMNSPFNLVVASTSVNLQKSDHIAAVPHLERWRRRNEHRIRDLLSIGGLADDQTRTLAVARFTYAQAERVRALGWLRGRELRDLTGWRDVLSA